MKIEKRLEKDRKVFSGKIEVSCLDTGICYPGISLELSKGGAKAQMNRSPGTGSRVQVTIFEKDHKTFSGFGTVAWSEPNLVGPGKTVGFMLGVDDDFISRKTIICDRFQYRQFNRSRQFLENKKTVRSIPCDSDLLAPDPVIIKEGESIRAQLDGKQIIFKIEKVDNKNKTGQICIYLNPLPKT